MCCNSLPPEQTWLNTLCLLPTIKEFAGPRASSSLLPAGRGVFHFVHGCLSCSWALHWGVCSRTLNFSSNTSVCTASLWIFGFPGSRSCFLWEKTRKCSAVYSWPQQLWWHRDSQENPEKLCSGFYLLCVSLSLELCRDIPRGSFCTMNKRRSREITN